MRSRGAGMVALVLAVAVGGCGGGGGAALEAGDDPSSRSVVGSCREATVAVAPDDLVEGAIGAMGSRPGAVLRYETVQADLQPHQSDRHYRPFFASFDVREVRYDPATAAEHLSGRFVYPGMGPTPPRSSAVTDAAAFVAGRDGLAPAPRSFEGARRSRELNPWAVLEDWAGDGDLRVAGECRYRDDWRVVLERSGRYGPERLFLDRETGFPVKLDRMVPHAVLGQRHVEVLWSTWLLVEDESRFPSASFRMADGELVAHRTVGRMTLEDHAAAELPGLPPTPAMAPDPWLEGWTAQTPDTLRISDDVVLLTHWGYNSALVASGDTVYVLDATLSEARARQDSAWVARLFPDRSEVAVVVTDVAWPHVGGVRFWVARGATVLVHPVSAPFLEELVARPWTLEPDALQRARDAGEAVPFHLAEVEQPTELAQGALRLVPIEGIGSEGALVAFVPGADFLWAGDYIQTLDGPSQYATEVVRAVERVGVDPGRTAAQHLPLTPWGKVVDVNGR